MRKHFFYGFLTILATSVALAQPPEEVPPPPPESAATASDPGAPAAEAAPTPAPVAEVKAAPPPPEDKRIKGVEVSPSVGFYPVGYDSINVTGAEGSRYFFQLVPAITMSSSFKTSTDRTIDFNAGYNLTYREYYNKNQTRRDFGNEVTGGMSIAWTPLIATSVNAVFDHFIKSGADNSQDSGLVLDVTPGVKFTLSPQLAIKLGYEFFLADNFTSPLGPDGVTALSDPIGDVDDLRRGSIISNATGFDNFGATPFGAIPGASPITTSAGTTTQSWVDNRAVLGVTWKATPSTSVGFTYKYIFAQMSNDDNQTLKGHYFIPTISQDLPWAGGSVSLTDEVRIRKYDYATVPGSISGSQVPLQNLRNRVTLAVSQDVNQYMSFDAFYRWHLVGKNADDYSNLDSNSWFYLGMIFKF